MRKLPGFFLLAGLLAVLGFSTDARAQYYYWPGNWGYQAPIYHYVPDDDSWSDDGSSYYDDGSSYNVDASPTYNEDYFERKNHPETYGNPYMGNLLPEQIWTNSIIDSLGTHYQ